MSAAENPRIARLRIVSDGDFNPTRVLVEPEDGDGPTYNLPVESALVRVAYGDFNRATLRVGRVKLDVFGRECERGKLTGRKIRARGGSKSHEVELTDAETGKPIMFVKRLLWRLTYRRGYAEIEIERRTPCP